MSRGCFIGIDQGSSATKAVVLSGGGEVLFRVRRDVSTSVRDAGQIEQDPLEILASVRDTLNEALRSVRDSGMAPLGIGLSCQRSSCLAWNESSGDPISTVVSWRDTRGLNLVRRLAELEPRIFKISGLPLTPYYSASKIRWLRDNLASGTETDVVFGTIGSFLVQRLTGARRAVIDHANAARTQLMNVQTLSWDAELLDAFGLSGVRLPEISPTIHVFGGIAAPGGAVPLLACQGDQQAAMIGLGVLHKGDGGINYGTGGFLMVNTGSTLAPAPGLMASVHYSNYRERSYLLEGSVNAVGDALEWCRSRFGMFKEYGEVDDLCRRASTDVVGLIGLNGTGAPHWEADISSAFHGLRPESSAADLVRAVVEGIAFFMKDIAETMRGAGIEAETLTVSGGLSSLSCLVRSQADILGRDIRVNPEQEASALGAAFLAGMQTGIWTPDAIRRIAAGGDVVRGSVNPALEKRYRRWKRLHGMTKTLDRLH